MANIALNILRFVNLRLPDDVRLELNVPSVPYRTWGVYSKQYPNGIGDLVFTTRWGYVRAEDLLKYIPSGYSKIWMIEAGEGPEFDTIYSVTQKNISERRIVEYGFDEIKIEFHQEYLDALPSMNFPIKKVSEKEIILKVEGSYKKLTEVSLMDNIGIEFGLSQNVSWDRNPPRFYFKQKEIINDIFKEFGYTYKNMNFYWKNKMVLQFCGDASKVLDKVLDERYIFFKDEYNYFCHFINDKTSWYNCVDSEYLADNIVI